MGTGKWILSTKYDCLINLENITVILLDMDGDLIARDINDDLIKIYSGNKEEGKKLLTRIAIWLKSDSRLFEV